MNRCSDLFQAVTLTDRVDEDSENVLLSIRQDEGSSAATAPLMREEHSISISLVHDCRLTRDALWMNMMRQDSWGP